MTTKHETNGFLQYHAAVVARDQENERILRLSLRNSNIVSAHGEEL